MSSCEDFMQFSMARFTGQILENESTEKLIIYTRSEMKLRAIISTDVETKSDETPGMGEDLDTVLSRHPEVDVEIYTDAHSEDHYSICELGDLAEIHLGCQIDRIVSIADERVYIEAGILRGDSLEDHRKTNICSHQFGRAEDFEREIL